MEATCSEQAILSFIRIIRIIFSMLEVIAPIVFMVSLAYLFLTIVMGSEMKEMNATKFKIKNALVATLVVFFLPVFIELVFLALGQKFEVSACWKAAGHPIFSTASSDYKPGSDDGPKSGSFIINPEKYKNKGIDTNPNEKYSIFKKKPYSSGDYKEQLFSKETLDIVNAHKNDFNYYNFNSFMSAQGGADKYIQSLGGVFTEYYGKNERVKSVEEFHKVCEYVFGLMTMWGFDYYGSAKYCKWGGKCNSYSKASDDAFYPPGVVYNNHGFPSNKDFDALITGKNGLNMTTACNGAVDRVFMKAGLFNNMYSQNYKNTCKNRITSLQNAQVGDLIHFFKAMGNKNDPSSWVGWYHVAFVGEVYDDKVVFYDGGSYFTSNRNYKWEAKKSDYKVHGNSGNWILCRPVTIG